MNVAFRPPFQADLQADIERVKQRYRCGHVKLEVRVVTASSGQPMYRNQCLQCGDGIGGWISPKALPRNQSFTDWDNTLATYQVRRNYTDKMVSVDYESYLRSDAWRAKRRAVLSRAAGVCEACGVSQPNEVHHLTYRNIGNEFLWELAAVCSSCHDRLHPEKRGVT